MAGVDDHAGVLPRALNAVAGDAVELQDEVVEMGRGESGHGFPASSALWQATALHTGWRARSSRWFGKPLYVLNKPWRRDNRDL